MTACTVFLIKIILKINYYIYTHKNKELRNKTWILTMRTKTEQTNWRVITGMVVHQKTKWWKNALEKYINHTFSLKYTSHGSLSFAWLRLNSLLLWWMRNHSKFTFHFLKKKVGWVWFGYLAKHILMEENNGKRRRKGFVFFWSRSWACCVESQEAESRWQLLY